MLWVFSLCPFESLCVAMMSVWLFSKNQILYFCWRVALRLSEITLPACWGPEVIPKEQINIALRALNKIGKCEWLNTLAPLPFSWDNFEAWINHQNSPWGSSFSLHCRSWFNCMSLNGCLGSSESLTPLTRRYLPPLNKLDPLHPFLRV